MALVSAVMHNTWKGSGMMSHCVYEKVLHTEPVYLPSPWVINIVLSLEGTWGTHYANFWGIDQTKKAQTME